MYRTNDIMDEIFYLKAFICKNSHKIFFPDRTIAAIIKKKNYNLLNEYFKNKNTENYSFEIICCLFYKDNKFFDFEMFDALFCCLEKQDNRMLFIDLISSISYAKMDTEKKIFLINRIFYKNIELLRSIKYILDERNIYTYISYYKNTFRFFRSEIVMSQCLLFLKKNNIKLGERSFTNFMNIGQLKIIMFAINNNIFDLSIKNLKEIAIERISNTRIDIKSIHTNKSFIQFMKYMNLPKFLNDEHVNIIIGYPSNLRNINGIDDNSLLNIFKFFSKYCHVPTLYLNRFIHIMKHSVFNVNEIPSNKCIKKNTKKVDIRLKNLIYKNSSILKYEPIKRFFRNYFVSNYSANDILRLSHIFIRIDSMNDFKTDISMMFDKN